MGALRPGSWALIQGGLMDVERASLAVLQYNHASARLPCKLAYLSPSSGSLHIRSNRALEKSQRWYLGESRVRQRLIAPSQPK